MARSSQETANADAATGPCPSAPPPPAAILMGEVAALTKALTGLTCGGSEFFIRRGDRYVADIDACVSYVRRCKEDAHKRTVRALHENRRLREALAEARDLLLERIQGSPARSAGHNARLTLEAALADGALEAPRTDASNTPGMSEKSS